METLLDHSEITVFVCANCARPAQVPTSSGRSKPAVPDFNWPNPVKQVVVPCTGRLQPENILKAFESGSSVVSVVACREDNCHHVEGSRRCSLRIDYVRSLLNEIGLGEERLLFFQLPGSASQDLALTAGKRLPEAVPDSMGEQIAAVREQSLRVFQAQPPNPLRLSAGENGGSDE